jgi:hypothetical protein
VGYRGTREARGVRTVTVRVGSNGIFCLLESFFVHASMSASLSSSISSAGRVVRSIAYFKRLSYQTRARLSADIAFVGLALR